MASSVGASIRYVNPEWRDRDERPRISSRETRRANTRFYDVEIEDARPMLERGELGLDTTGFVLVPHRTRVRDFRNAGEVSLSYYPEITRLIKGLTGADDVAILHHVLRTEEPASFNQAYARFVHLDYSEGEAIGMSRRLMVERGICKRNETDRYDFAWYNTWQPIEREVQHNPLTMIDARSLEPADIVDYVFGDEAGDYGVASMPLHSPSHRHYYFPRMQRDEVIVLKQLDSRSGRWSRCPHTSFDDPTAPSDSLRRRSIEVRMMCVFERSAP